MYNMTCFRKNHRRVFNRLWLCDVRYTEAAVHNITLYKIACNNGYMTTTTERTERCDNIVSYVFSGYAGPLNYIIILIQFYA